MKAFFHYFFGVGTEQEFALFTPAHFAPILVMLGTIYLIYRFRDRLRDTKFDERFRYFLAFALIISEMSYYWRLVGMPELNPNPVEHLPIGVCTWATIFCSYMVIGKSQTLFDISYFWLLCASVFAVLTPTPLTYTGPTRYRYYQFWAEHTLGYIAIFYMIFVHRMRPTVKSAIRSYAALAAMALLALGFDPNGADGKFGRNTKKAVIAFQKANDLSSDGVVGEQTYARLMDASANDNKVSTAQTLRIGTISDASALGRVSLKTLGWFLCTSVIALVLAGTIGLICYSAGMFNTVLEGLTASTGMDALTHAIEGFTTKAAWEMTDMFHLKAIELISKHLHGAVENTAEGREGMALGQYVAGMGFSNVGLGIVHSMAHCLGAVYDTPHGVGNAILLPTIMEYNAPVTGDKYKYIAAAMGVEGVENMTVEEYRKAACDAVKQLSADVGIPADLKEIVNPADLDFLAESAFADACRPGNPRDTSVEEIAALYRQLL